MCPSRATNNGCFASIFLPSLYLDAREEDVHALRVVSFAQGQLHSSHVNCVRVLVLRVARILAVLSRNIAIDRVLYMGIYYWYIGAGAST